MKIVTDRPKQLKGVLNKSWYEHPELGLCLFKAASLPRMPIPNVRNDWSEKARETSEFSLLLDIPAPITKLTDDREDADDLSLGE